jgi:hypothetical protein
VCPDCATKSDQRLSSSRKTLLGWSYALAIWCTLGLVVLLSGALAEFAADPQSAELLGVGVWVLIFIPALIGMALSLSSVDRRLRNPPAVWGAVVWNGLLMGVLLLLTIAGMFMQ